MALFVMQLPLREETVLEADLVTIRCAQTVFITKMAQ